MARHIDLDDVERLWRADPQSAPLADRVTMQAAVKAYDVALGSRDLARLERPFVALIHLIARVLFDEGRVISIGHKTDLLALGLLGGLQAERAGDLAHLGFRHVAE